MEIKEINLLKYRGNKSTLFTGRPQGETARKELNLDSLDNKDNIQIKIIIPKGTTSFNPSFFLGMFNKSIKNLGIDKFNDKYIFYVEDTEDEMKNILLNNIEEGKQYAINSLNSNLF